MVFRHIVAPFLRPTFTLLLCLSLLLTPPSPTFSQEQQQSSPPRQAVQRPAPSPQPQPPASPSPTPPLDASEEIIRVSTELVQTDVMVFDRQGRFVDNLQRDQFELRVDGRPQTISFFERVRAGTVNDDARLATARGASRPAASPALPEPHPSDRRRTVLFFIDDFHLAQDSLERTRRVLTHFVDNEMGQNDQVAVASASGQLGFLQQLTNNPAVLRVAIARLKSRERRIIDMEQPPMTENQAVIIEEGTNPAVLAALRQQSMSRITGLTEDGLRLRARQIVAQSTAITTNTLMALEGLVRTSARLPGRKVVFFISDGFYISFRNSATTEGLRRITDAATRSGVVIYTMDAHGLATQPSMDASRQPVSDLSAGLMRSNATEIASSQEPLQTLAADTGGRALLNTNALEAAIPRVLRETSQYYLLAWTPESQEQRRNRFRQIEVSIRGRPELTVSGRRGFYDTAPPAPQAASSGRSAQAAKPPEVALLSAISAASPVTALPTRLSLGYMDAPNTGAVLTVTTQLDTAALDFTDGGGVAPEAIVDVASIVYDDQGRAAQSAHQRLTISRTRGTGGADGGRPQRFTFNQQYRVAPGLYQVRVAARESKTGMLGSAMEWIEIPQLAAGTLSLSSLFIGDRPADASGAGGVAAATAPEVVVSADHRFSQASTLRLFLYIYNAAHANAPPDLALRVEVFRDGQPVISSPPRRVSMEGVTDLARIPYAAEISLEGMPAGRYVLQVTAIDRAARANSSQRVNFQIE